MSNETSNIGIVVDQLIDETRKLFSTIVRKTEPSDQRSRRHKSGWTERHRLLVLLEAAEQTRKHFDKGIVVSPWFLAELKATIELIHHWRDKPIWKDIEPSLVNSTNFTHTIAKLHIAEHLMRQGHKVELIPKGKTATPDLKVKAIGGTEDWANIECYRPKPLDGGSRVEQRQIKKIIEKSMKKAKKQLESGTPGILAICGFNQTRSTIENLRKTIVGRLQKTERSNLCGMIIAMLSILLRKRKGGASFTPIVSFHFVPNPNYFGRVEIDSRIPKDDPKLITGPLYDINTDVLLSKKIGELEDLLVPSPRSVVQEPAQVIMEQRLELAQEPPPKSRVVMYSENETTPLFRGDGNINSLCGNCNVLLVEHAWRLSISNLLIKCPSCQSYNEFPEIKLPEHSTLKKIGIMKENYNLMSVVVLKRGLSIVGL